MSKKYTADEMLEIADELGLVNDEYHRKASAMLRQAADNMEHTEDNRAVVKDGKSSRRKWLDSGVRIRSVGGLIESICEYGGAMWFGKFRNRHFFLNQQMHSLLLMIDRGSVSYPIQNRKDK